MGAAHLEGWNRPSPRNAFAALGIALSWNRRVGGFPAAAEREEQLHQVVRKLRLGLRELRFDFGEAAFGVQDDLEVLAPGLVAQPGDARGLLAPLAGAAQRRDPLAFVRVAGERALRFLQRIEPGAVELGKRGLRRRLRLRDARAGGATIGEVPGDQRPEAVAEAVAVEPTEPPRLMLG
jgi:hypothetical protein